MEPVAPMTAAATAAPQDLVATATTAGSRAIDALITYGPRAVGVLLALLAAWFLAGWMRRIVQRGLEAARLEPTLARFVAHAARYALLTLAVLSCLGAFGIETTSFAAVIGASGLAIALAFQGSLGNLAAGVMLLVFRPFRVGDTVIVAGKAGKVMEIELFSTLVDAPDNRRYFIPNGAIFGATIENVTHHPERRVDIEVGSDAPTEEARAAFTKAVATIPDVLPAPAPEILLSGLATWTIRVWCRRERFDAVHEATLRAAREALVQLAKRAA